MAKNIIEILEAYPAVAWRSQSPEMHRHLPGEKLSIVKYGIEPPLSYVTVTTVIGETEGPLAMDIVRIIYALEYLLPPQQTFYYERMNERAFGAVVSSMESTADIELRPAALDDIVERHLGIAFLATGAFANIPISEEEAIGKISSRMQNMGPLLPKRSH